MKPDQRFDPTKYVSTAVEDDNPKVLQMAYHLSTIDEAELPARSDIQSIVDQELVDLNNLYTDMKEFETRLKEIAHEGVITPEQAQLISKKHPEAIVTTRAGVEGRGETAIDFQASLENMNRIKFGLIIAAIISAITLLLKWVSNKVSSAKEQRINAQAATKSINTLLKKTDIDIVQVFKDSLAQTEVQQSEQNRQIVFAIKQILGAGVTTEQVVKAFGSGEVNYARLLVNSDINIQRQINTVVLATPEELECISQDTKFLVTEKPNFSVFITDCAHFSNDIPRWLTGMKDGIGVGRDGRSLSPEAPINVIHLDVVVNMSKMLNLALEQPTTGANVTQAHQFITISKPSIAQRIAKYQTRQIDEPLTTQKFTHLNDPDKITDQLKEQRKQLDAWKSMIRHNSSMLGGMSKRLKYVQSQVNGMPRDTHAKVAELETLAAMIVSNFSSISRYLVTVDGFNTNTTTMFARTVNGIQHLNKTLTQTASGETER